MSVSASDAVEQLLQFLFEHISRLAVGFEITAVRIGDSLVGNARRVFVDHVNFSAAAQLIDLLDVSGRHHEDEIGFGDDGGRELSRAADSAVEPWRRHE